MDAFWWNTLLSFLSILSRGNGQDLSRELSIQFNQVLKETEGGKRMMVSIDPTSLAPLRTFDGEYGIIFSALLLSSPTTSTDFGVASRALSLITRKVGAKRFLSVFQDTWALSRWIVLEETRSELFVALVMVYSGRWLQIQPKRASSKGAKPTIYQFTANLAEETSSCGEIYHHYTNKRY